MVPADQLPKDIKKLIAKGKQETNYVDIINVI